MILHYILLPIYNLHFPTKKLSVFGKNNSCRLSNSLQTYETSNETSFIFLELVIKLITEIANLQKKYSGQYRY